MLKSVVKLLAAEKTISARKPYTLLLRRPDESTTIAPRAWWKYILSKQILQIRVLKQFQPREPLSPPALRGQEREIVLDKEEEKGEEAPSMTNERMVRK